MPEFLNSVDISMGKDISSPAFDWESITASKPEPTMKRISSVVSSLRDSRSPLSDAHLWQAIAAEASTAWQQAKADLSRADADLCRIESDEEIPLGSIGNALDGEETAHIREAQRERLAQFVLIDETLRTDEGLQQKLDDLRAHWSMIETSLDMSREMREMTRELEKVAPPAPFTLRGIFGRFSKKLAEQNPDLPTLPVFSPPQPAV
jgi:hypothetical protein